MVGCLIYVFSRYRTLEQSVIICDGSSQIVVVRRWRVWCIAINSTRNMFCNPSSISTIMRILQGLYMPYPAFSRI